MLSILIIVMDVFLTLFGIYLFDYRLDNQIDDVPVIILCLIVGTVLTILLVWIFIELVYLMLPKGKIQKSIFVHKLTTQIASVPFHFSRMRLTVTGLETLPKEHGFTIYSNHNSWIDPTLIMNALYQYPVVGLGKESTFKIPVIGKFAPKLGFVKIQRENIRQSAMAIKTAISRVKEGYPMIIFPEGTRNPRTDTVLDFKAGAFKVALRSERPIVPITLVKPKKKKWRFITKISIVVHKPLAYDEFKTMKTIELANEIQKIISSSL